MRPVSTPATQTAHAPVPQASVMPLPRSQVRIVTSFGEWTLTMQGGRGPQERALTIKDNAGKLAATMGGGRGAPIEIADISMKGSDLVLKFKQPGRGGDPMDATVTLSMQPDGTLKATQMVGTNSMEGTGKKKAS